jgi:hypothetical protein
MSTGAPETVWILGAGFSRSLGGPLLDDLFGTEPSDIEFEFPGVRYPGLALAYKNVRGVFQWGKHVGKKWTDAEGFLVFVDKASADALENGPNGAIFRRVCAQAQWRDPLTGWSGDSVFGGRASDVDSFVENARRLTRQALAVECSRFLRDPDISAEAWLPYTKWAGSLRGAGKCKNTIITFNYDRVLEHLGDFQVPVPAEVEQIDDFPVRVLKLHGSVDWQIKDDRCRRVPPEAGIKDPSIELALAAPGQSKARMTTTVFLPLWKAARDALKTADAVIFLGYSFPPSDALARDEILSAVAGNTTSPLQRIDIVLGEDLNAPRSRRMKSLAESCKGATRLRLSDCDGLDVGDIGPDSRILQIEQHPLRAEDYLDVHQRYFGGLEWPIDRTGATS